jgi:hypothetical protein
MAIQRLTKKNHSDSDLASATSDTFFSDRFRDVIGCFTASLKLSLRCTGCPRQGAYNVSFEAIIARRGMGFDRDCGSTISTGRRKRPKN